MRFDLVIPARNEAANIQDALRRLVLTLNIQFSTFNNSDAGVDWRIVVAVNGTTDDTLRRINEYRISNIEYGDRIVAIECPGVGKGAAIRYAAEQCRVLSRSAQSQDLDDSPYVFGFIDADLSADPDMILPMVESIVRGEADAAIGSRLMQAKTTNRGWLRTLSSKFFNLLVHLFLGLKVKDAQCGLKIMNAKARDILVTCREDGWFLDIEFLAKAVQDGLKVLEMPVPWIEFRYAGRKSQIRYLKDGWEMLKAMRRIRRRLKTYV